MRFDGKLKYEQFDVRGICKCPYCGADFPVTLSDDDVWSLLECGGVKYMCPSCGEYDIYNKDDE